MKTLVFAMALLAASGLAAASPHEYLLGLGSIVICNPLGDPDIGGVCLPPGHVVPSSTGEISILILDDVIPTPGGLACQDLDSDGVCGGASEASVHFCGAFTSLGWSPGVDVQVFIDDPITGSPLLTTCGLASFGVHGFVSHS